MTRANLVGACAFLCALGAEAKMPGLRMVQLDLARQTETCSFVSNYVDRVSSFGYDTLLLYLEARVATKTFALPKGECYTADEMRGIVAYAAEFGEADFLPAYFDRRRMKFRSTLTLALESETKQWK